MEETRYLHMKKAYIACSGEYGNLVISPPPKTPYLNGSTKVLGGRCNNICLELKRGRHYTDSGWCRHCARMILSKDWMENKAGVKTCPCCSTNIRRKSRYSGNDAQRGKEWREAMKTPNNPNEIYGTRICRKCHKGFPRKLHQGNKRFCDDCKK